MSLVGYASELIERARIYRLVMAPSGRAFANLALECVEVFDAVLGLEDILSTDVVPNAQFVLIKDLELADNGLGDRNPLGLLRQRVSAMLDAGACVVLMSRFPKIRYPEVAGSSLLEDARDYHPQLRECAADSHRLQALPAWLPGLGEEEFLTELVAELGIPLAARLDQVLFESPLGPVDALRDLATTELDALHFAGLLTPTGPNSPFYRWSTPRAIGDLKNAVANVLARCQRPPRDLAEAYETLWKIERVVRAAMRATAIGQWGSGWKDSIVRPNYEGKVLDRAGAVAYPGLRRVTVVRDPLEWLTLGELLALRQEKPQLGDLGMEAPFWRRLEVEVLPVRNQVSHMRLTKPGDLTRLKNWEAILSRRLRA